jgi:RNA polymerase sigma-70 factor (ECF subfamily)
MPGILRPIEPLDALLVAAGVGNQVAFGRVFDLTSAWVCGIVFSCLHDVGESAAVTLDVYGEIWRQAPRYDVSVSAAIEWIVDVAIRESLDRTPETDPFALATPA